MTTTTATKPAGVATKPVKAKAPPMYRVELTHFCGTESMPPWTHRAMLRGSDDRRIIARMGMSEAEALRVLSEAIAEVYPKNERMREAVRTAEGAKAGANG